MNYDMTDFDMMDRNAEAKRVALAFGVEGECRFYRIKDWLELRRAKSKAKIWENEIGIQVKYVREGTPGSIGGRYYFVTDRFNNGYYLIFHWDGSTTGPHPILWPHKSKINITPSLLAKPLFHLNLLTPEVEVALGASISAHEKIEWALEYEARNGL